MSSTSHSTDFNTQAAQEIIRRLHAGSDPHTWLALVTMCIIDLPLTKVAQLFNAPLSSHDSAFHIVGKWYRFDRMAEHWLVDLSRDKRILLRLTSAAARLSRPGQWKALCKRTGVGALRLTTLRKMAIDVRSLFLTRREDGEEYLPATELVQFDEPVVLGGQTADVEASANATTENAPLSLAPLFAQANDAQRLVLHSAVRLQLLPTQLASLETAHIVPEQRLIVFGGGQTVTTPKGTEAFLTWLLSLPRRLRLAYAASQLSNEKWQQLCHCVQLPEVPMEILRRATFVPYDLAMLWECAA